MALLLALAGGCGSSTGQHCAADSPCGGRKYLCAGPNAYQEAVDLDCHTLCGPGPCSGGTCWGRGPQLACPAGTTCVSPPPLTDASAPPCVPVDAGADGPTAGDAPNNSTVTSQEGQACSIDLADDPQLVCSKVAGLTCISTYSRSSARVDGGLRAVFVCRLPCTATTQCPQPGDVCCPGEIRAGGQASRGSACVPPSNCEAVDGGP